MLPVLIAMVIGAGLGLWRAKRAKGNALDMAQYAAVHGIAFGLVTMILVLVLLRSA